MDAAQQFAQPTLEGFSLRGRRVVIGTKPHKRITLDAELLFNCLDGQRGSEFAIRANQSIKDYLINALAGEEAEIVVSSYQKVDDIETIGRVFYYLDDLVREGAVIGFDCAECQQGYEAGLLQKKPYSHTHGPRQGARGRNYFCPEGHKLYGIMDAIS